MKMLVFTNPRPGRDDEYNDWYSNVHLKDLLSIPGVVGAQRFRRVISDPDGQPQYSYLAVYELDRDFGEVAKELGERAGAGAMVISEALDSEGALITAWEEI